MRFDYGNQEIYKWPSNFTLGRRYTLKLDKGQYYVDGRLIEGVDQSTFDNGFELYLCALNNFGSLASFVNMDFYYAKIWKNDVLVRDYIPSMVGGVYGLYDKVSGSFGPFIGDGTVSPIQ